VSQCCQQNICYMCMSLHINTKMGGEEERMTVPCPSCNTDGAIFDRVRGAVASRIYDESPKTKGLLARLSMRTGGGVTDSMTRRFTAQSTPRPLVRHRSDPARTDFAIASPTFAPSPRQSTFGLGLDPLNLKRIQSIPEHNDGHIMHYTGTGEAANTTDFSISPSFSPQPPVLRQPTIFSFASTVPVAAS